MKFLILFQNLFFLLAFSSLSHCFPQIENKLVSLPPSSSFSGPSSTWSLGSHSSSHLCHLQTPYQSTALPAALFIPLLPSQPQRTVLEPAMPLQEARPCKGRACAWNTFLFNLWELNHHLLGHVPRRSITLVPPQCSWQLWFCPAVNHTDSQWILHLQASLLWLNSLTQLCVLRPKTQHREALLENGTLGWHVYIHPHPCLMSQKETACLKMSSVPGSKEMDTHTVKNDRTRKKHNLAPNYRCPLELKRVIPLVRI